MWPVSNRLQSCRFKSQGCSWVKCKNAALISACLKSHDCSEKHWRWAKIQLNLLCSFSTNSVWLWTLAVHFGAALSSGVCRLSFSFSWRISCMIHLHNTWLQMSGRRFSKRQSILQVFLWMRQPVSKTAVSVVHRIWNVSIILQPENSSWRRKTFVGL